MPDDYSPHTPHITGGTGIAVETTAEGYRISQLSVNTSSYTGFFQVLPYPNYVEHSVNRTVQVINGMLPYDEAIKQSAGYVLIDRFYYVPEEDGGPQIESWRLPVTVPQALGLAVDKSSIIYLEIAAHHYKSDGNCYPEADGSHVTFLSNYRVLTQAPTPRLGTVYFPLASVSFDNEAGTFSITQLSRGVPSGAIARYSKTGPQEPEE